MISEICVRYLMGGTGYKASAIDPYDKVILGLVKPSNASFIITGDKDLLVLGSYLNVRIVSPRQFWDENINR